MSSPERARDAIDLVAATVNAPAGFVEHAIFGEDLVNGCAPTLGSFSPKTSLRLRVSKVDMLLDIGLSPLGIECAFEIFLLARQQLS